MTEWFELDCSDIKWGQLQAAQGELVANQEPQVF